MSSRMYSPGSPVLSSNQVLEHHSPMSLVGSPMQQENLSFQQQQQQQSGQCLRFKYFTTFFICTTCLALLSASLATHKWIVSKPIRILRLNGGQTNFTSLMLAAQSDSYQEQQVRRPSYLAQSSIIRPAAIQSGEEPQPGGGGGSQNNKFQGDIYFGLFKGVKVLNHGFGDRHSQISVLQAHFNRDNNNNSNQQELINFKLWLVTVVGVAVAILFALIGSIFAIINFVMTPRGTLTGPVGLVIWNATACFACLLAMVSWLIEYFVHLQVNVLSLEEVQNGWTSENRSQFGYSYYFVVLAFVLHLVNIFIVSIVQFESWTSNGSAKAVKRQTRPLCEGVIMLY